MSQANPVKSEVDAYAASYVLHGCQSTAWRKAFPNSKAKSEVVNISASRLHSLPNVQLRVKQLTEKSRIIAEEKFDIDAQWLLGELKGVRDMDVLDIMESDLKSFKPLDKWPSIWRREISGIDLMTLSNNDENIESIIKKIKWPDKTKNRELIGKHINVQAFSENLNVRGGSDVTPWGEVKASVDKLSD